MPGFQTLFPTPLYSARLPAKLTDALEKQIDRHVAIFARQAQFDLGRRKLAMDSIWVNVMRPGAVHAPHIHPHAAVSGTFYVTAPPGASAIRFEDPRLGLMMAAPPRRKNASIENRQFVDVQPKAGTLLLWESWLRHGVQPHTGKSPRISISFNYRMD